MAKRRKRRGCLSTILWICFIFCLPGLLLDVWVYFWEWASSVTNPKLAVIGAAIFFLCVMFFSIQKACKPKSILKVNSMNGIQFEHYCASILPRMGFSSIKVTKASGDQGVDIIATKNGVRYAIQCKHYSGNVGNFAVQEVFAGAKYYGCSRAAVITNSYFTQSAIDLANATGVILYDRSDLARCTVRKASVLQSFIIAMRETIKAQKEGKKQASNEYKESPEKMELTSLQTDHASIIKHDICAGKENVEMGKNCEMAYDGDSAIMYYEKAISAGYAFPHPYKRLVEMYCIRKQIDKATLVCEKAIRNILKESDKTWFKKRLEEFER